jgi:hypothetical protein
MNTVFCFSSARPEWSMEKTPGLERKSTSRNFWSLWGPLFLTQCLTLSIRLMFSYVTANCTFPHFSSLYFPSLSLSLTVLSLTVLSLAVLSLTVLSLTFHHCNQGPPMSWARHNLPTVSPFTAGCFSGPSSPLPAGVLSPGLLNSLCFMSSSPEWYSSNFDAVAGGHEQ